MKKDKDCRHAYCHKLELLFWFSIHLVGVNLQEKNYNKLKESKKNRVPDTKDQTEK